MRVAARSLLWVACCVSSALGVGEAASATPVTVVMTGHLTLADDSNSVTDGSIALGAAYTLTMVYDDSVADSDPDPTFGAYLVPASMSSYSVSVGNYVFDAAGVLILDLLDGFYQPTEDQVAWFVDKFSITGVLDPGVSVGPVTYSNPSLYDYTGVALSSDRLTAANWNRSAYAPDNQAFWLFVEVLDPRTTVRDYIELNGTIEQIVVVLPEPAVALLLLCSLAAWLALRTLRA